MKLAIVGEFDPEFEPHAATNAAIEHSRVAFELDLEFDWVSTADLETVVIDSYHGFWIAPGSPYRDLEKTLALIRHTRENGIPTLGTCGGFQHVVLEYARNVLGLTDAKHAEYDPYASRLFISELACSLVGQTLRIQIEPNTLASRIYRAETAEEKYYCNFSIHPDYNATLRQSDLVISGIDQDNEIRIVELAEHPFFLATLFVPQTLSTRENPHLIVSEFLRAIQRVNSGGKVVEYLTRLLN